MTAGVKTSPGREKEIIKMYLAGYSASIVAERFGLCPSGVYNILKRNNVDRRNKGDRPKGL